MGLLTGSSYDVVARSANVSEKTVRRRLADPGFRDRLDDARRDLVDRATTGLLSAVTLARQTLVQVMVGEQYAATARVNAARAILQEARAYHHDTVLEVRLQAVEAAQRAVSQRPAL